MMKMSEINPTLFVKIIMSFLEVVVLWSEPRKKSRHALLLINLRPRIQRRCLPKTW